MVIEISQIQNSMLQKIASDCDKNKNGKVDDSELISLFNAIRNYKIDLSAEKRVFDRKKQENLGLTGAISAGVSALAVIKTANAISTSRELGKNISKGKEGLLMTLVALAVPVLCFGANYLAKRKKSKEMKDKVSEAYDLNAEMRKLLSPENSADGIVKYLDKADGKETGAIEGNLWNCYTGAMYVGQPRNSVSRFISTEDAKKSLSVYDSKLDFLNYTRK